MFTYLFAFTQITLDSSIVKASNVYWGREFFEFRNLYPICGVKYCENLWVCLLSNSFSWMLEYKYYLVIDIMTCGISYLLEENLS